MNTATRELVAQAVIILAICVGGWMLFVQPKMIELAKLEATIEKQRNDSAAAEEHQVQELATQAAGMRDRVKAIEASGRLGRDSSLLYETMMSMAREHAVYVQSLQPGELGAGTAVSTRKVSMSIQGTYQQIASFVHAVNEMPDFIRPNSMVFVPRRDEQHNPTVHANVSWDVLVFNLPQELAYLKGADDVLP